MAARPGERLGVQVHAPGAAVGPAARPLGGERRGAAEVLAEEPRLAPGVAVAPRALEEIDVPLHALDRDLVERVRIGRAYGVARSCAVHPGDVGDLFLHRSFVEWGARPLRA